MLRIDGLVISRLPKNQILTVVSDIFKTSAIKHSIENSMLPKLLDSLLTLY